MRWIGYNHLISRLAQNEQIDLLKGMKPNITTLYARSTNNAPRVDEPSVFSLLPSRHVSIWSYIQGSLLYLTHPLTPSSLLFLCRIILDSSVMLSLLGNLPLLDILLDSRTRASLHLLKSLLKLRSPPTLLHPLAEFLQCYLCFQYTVPNLLLAWAHQLVVQVQSLRQPVVARARFANHEN